MEWVAKTAGSWLGQVRDQAEDSLLAQDWEWFGSQVSQDRQEALRLRAVLTAYVVTIPDVIEPSLMEGLQQARDPGSPVRQARHVRRAGQTGRAGMPG